MLSLSLFFTLSYSLVELVSSVMYTRFNEVESSCECEGILLIVEFCLLRLSLSTQIMNMASNSFEEGQFIVKRSLQTTTQQHIANPIEMRPFERKHGKPIQFPYIFRVVHFFVVVEPSARRIPKRKSHTRLLYYAFAVDSFG